MTLCVESSRTPSQKQPQIAVNGKVINESRHVRARTHGPIPPGMFVCHRCDNPRCIRLDHLFLGTDSDNQRDAVAKGRHAETKRTQCPSGHLYDAENTYRTPGDGDRRCKECNRERARRNYWAQKAAS